jgi:hypothetical protein
VRGLIRCAVSDSLRNRNSLGVTATPAAVGETSTTPEARTTRNFAEPPSTWWILVRLTVVVVPCVAAGGAGACGVSAAPVAGVTPVAGCVATAMLRRLALESKRTRMDPAVVIAVVRDGG